MRDGLVRPCLPMVLVHEAATSWHSTPGLTVASAASYPSLVASATRIKSAGGLPRYTVRDTAQWYRSRQPLSSRHVEVPGGEEVRVALVADARALAAMLLEHRRQMLERMLGRVLDVVIGVAEDVVARQGRGQHGRLRVHAAAIPIGCVVVQGHDDG